MTAYKLLDCGIHMILPSKRIVTEKLYALKKKSFFFLKKNNRTFICKR